MEVFAKEMSKKIPVNLDITLKCVPEHKQQCQVGNQANDHFNLSVVERRFGVTPVGANYDAAKNGQAHQTTM